LREPVAVVFAKRLKAARALRGVSQRTLGGIVTGSKGNGGVRINRYEQGVNRADMDTAAALARALDVPLAYLFAEDDDQAELLLAFAQLTKSERAKLLAHIKRAVADKTRKGGATKR
jgi:transcriptional regulator with XRE-family HTH domain